MFWIKLCDGTYIYLLLFIIFHKYHINQVNAFNPDDRQNSRRSKLFANDNEVEHVTLVDKMANF